MRWFAVVAVALFAACTQAPPPAVPAASAPGTIAPNTGVVSATGLGGGTAAQQASRELNQSLGQDSRNTATQGAPPPPGPRRNDFDVGGMGAYPQMPSQVSPAFRGL